jgi:hypothetical protein
MIKLELQMPLWVAKLLYDCLYKAFVNYNLTANAINGMASNKWLIKAVAIDKVAAQFPVSIQNPNKGE